MIMCTFLSTRYRSQRRFAVRITVDPDGVFESCDARLRDVGGQFTVLERVRGQFNVLYDEMLESCGTPGGPRQHAGRGQSLHRALLVFEVSALSSRTEGKTSFFSRRHADVMKTSTLSLRTLRATFPATRNMTWHGTRRQLNAFALRHTQHASHLC